MNRLQGQAGWTQAIAVLVGLVPFLAWSLWQVLQGRVGWGPAWQIYFFGLDSSLYVWWLALFPIAFLFRRVRLIGGLGTTARRPATCFLVCVLVGIAAAASFGWNVRNLPLLYHDEYSYLFQAQTFLAGRLWFPVHSLGDHFDQVHVLNDSVFASRYFPGTGLWLMPFVDLGAPVVGCWVANGLIAGLVALVGRRFSPATGYLAGFAAACAPGMVVLGNHLLSPGPTMLGFALFLWSFLRFLEAPRVGRGVVAGSAIGFAFLCRPLTATGLGFPFALYALYRTRSEPPVNYSRSLAALIGSFACWCVALAAFNAAITGSPVHSPYGVYTARHTPSHLYGFYNRTRGMARRGNDVQMAYDEWAEDLTPARAFELTMERWWGLLRWSLGVIPTCVFGVWLLLEIRRFDDRVLLLLLALAGLTAVHVPFGFLGLLGWGYLFEAMPILLLLLAIAAGRLTELCEARGWPTIGAWWLALPAIAIAMNLLSFLPSAFASGSELVAPRLQAERRQQLERDAAKDGPIVVLVDADPKHSLHSTLVWNRPDLNDAIVRAWYRGPQSAALVRQHFVNRAVFLCKYDERGWIVHWGRL